MGNIWSVNPEWLTVSTSVVIGKGFVRSKHPIHGIEPRNYRRKLLGVWEFNRKKATAYGVSKM